MGGGAAGARAAATRPVPRQTRRPVPAHPVPPAPPTVNASRRCRHARTTAGSCAASLRNTTPHRPRGRRRTAAAGSGVRTGSVNSHSGGGAPASQRRRDLTARAQATSLMSMPDTPTPDTPTPDIAARLAHVQARIDAALAAAGRPPGAARLVAVSKTHPAAAVEQALAAGQALFGENRVQEAAAKFPALRPAHPGLRLHLIGGLQTNKAREAVRVADVIETLDRPRLADAIADAIQKEARTPGLLVQVNVGDEPQKAGVPTAEADALIEACMARFGPALLGLMCIPPAEGDPAPHFRWLAARAAAHGLGVLSMGMSGDFEAAIAHGATHVRVGTAIFGGRPTPA